MQQYTGGTTGIAQGRDAQPRQHRGQHEPDRRLGLRTSSTRRRRVIAVLPFFHIFAMTACMNVPLCNGTQVIMLPRFELKAFLDTLTRTGVNILPAVPTLIARAGQGWRQGSQAAPRRAGGGGFGRRVAPQRNRCAPLPRSPGAACRGLWADRGLAGGLLRRAARALQAGVDRPAAAGHRYPLRRRRYRPAGGAGRTRRTAGQGPAGHAGLLQQPRRPPRMPSSMAGCGPATSATWTRTAMSSSSTASRT